MPRYFFTTIALSLFFLPFAVVRAEDGQEDIHSPYAVSPDEKEVLLEKAEIALTWFRGLDRELRSTTPPNRFRERLAPLELMQAAAILKEKGQLEASRMLREMLPFFQVTPSECFEIEERLGDDVLASFQDEKEILAGETVDSTTRIRQGAARFLKDSLRPAERMALIESPKTAPELMKAIGILAVSGRPVLTRFYLRHFLDTEAEPEEYAEIVETVGSGNLNRIARNPRFEPFGEPAVMKIYSGAKRHWQDAGIVSEALDQWQKTETTGTMPPEAAQSLRALWQGEQLSIEQLLEKLGEVRQAEEADKLLAVLLSFGPPIKEALAESLQSDNRTLVENAARGLGVSVTAGESFLLYPALFPESSISPSLREDLLKQLMRLEQRTPTPEIAASVLSHRAGDYFERNRALKVDPDGYVRFWNWDIREKKAKYIRMLVPAAYRCYTQRYAEQAWKIDPDQPDLRRLYLTSLFDRAAYLYGIDETWDPAKADSVLESASPTWDSSALSTEELSDVLRDALETEHVGAALLATRLLGATGKTDLLKSSNGKPSLLVRAAMSQDRRVRFAGIEAVMNLNPDSSYPGSSFVLENLVWFARADGRRVLVSANPNQSEAVKTAGYFIGCGYQGEIAQTGMQALQLAASTPDVEMVVVDLLCDEPSVPNLVQQMRADPRTHDIPIAVLTDKAEALDMAPNFLARPMMQKVDRVGDNPFAVSLSQIYPPVFDDEAARWVEEDLMEKTGTETVPPVVRLAQARRALQWIREIVRTQSGEGAKIYHIEGLEEIVFGALRSQTRVLDGLELAAIVKSASMQDVIYTIASDAGCPMELREKAAEAFKTSVDSFGVLLRGRQVQRLYDRYNASEPESKESQKLLGDLIDVVEKKTFENTKEE